MSAIAAGDLGELYADHADWLRGWLGRRTRCPQRASDLAQDTFCRLLERETAETPRDARSYLATVARRLLIDDVRRRELEAAFLAACDPREADTVTPERVLAAVELLDAVGRLLADLPDEVRAAFLLRRLDGLSHAEIAARLGVSDRTVKRHVARAYASCYAAAYPD